MTKLASICFVVVLTLWANQPSLTFSIERPSKPLKVFILMGQSNMQGHAHIRTLPHLGMDTTTQPILKQIVDGDGAPRLINDVWISYLSSSGVRSGQLTTGFGASEDKIGPELTFGIYMQQRLQEPILIIKTAWGGKSIHTDFRPPSAGDFVFQPSRAGAPSKTRQRHRENKSREKERRWNLLPKVIEPHQECAAGHPIRLSKLSIGSRD